MSSEESIPHPKSKLAKRDNLPYQTAFQGREVYTKFTDPCEGANKATMTCLNKNDYNRDACLAYFEAYRECKNAWLKERRNDRKNGKIIDA